MYTHCCHKSKATLESLQSYPYKIKRLIDGSDRSSADFKERIRSRKVALCFDSTGAEATPIPVPALIV